MKYSNFDDKDRLECDCSPLAAPKIAQEEGGVKNGNQTFPMPVPATQDDELEFVAQGPVIESGATIDAEQARKLSEVAAKLQGAGDQLVQQYGPQMGVSLIEFSF